MLCSISINSMLPDVVEQQVGPITLSNVSENAHRKVGHRMV